MQNEAERLHPDAWGGAGRRLRKPGAEGRSRKRREPRPWAGNLTTGAEGISRKTQRQKRREPRPWAGNLTARAEGRSRKTNAKNGGSRDRGREIWRRERRAEAEKTNAKNGGSRGRGREAENRTLLHSSGSNPHSLPVPVPPSVPPFSFPPLPAPRPSFFLFLFPSPSPFSPPPPLLRLSRSPFPSPTSSFFSFLSLFFLSLFSPLFSCLPLATRQTLRRQTGPSLPQDCCTEDIREAWDGSTGAPCSTHRSRHIFIYIFEGPLLRTRAPQWPSARNRPMHRPYSAAAHTLSQPDAMSSPCGQPTTAAARIRAPHTARRGRSDRKRRAFGSREKDARIAKGGRSDRETRRRRRRSIRDRSARQEAPVPRRQPVMSKQ